MSDCWFHNRTIPRLYGFQAFKTFDRTGKVCPLHEQTNHNQVAKLVSKQVSLFYQGAEPIHQCMASWYRLSIVLFLRLQNSQKFSVFRTLRYSDKISCNIHFTDQCDISVTFLLIFRPKDVLQCRLIRLLSLSKLRMFLVRILHNRKMSSVKIKISLPLKMCT